MSDLDARAALVRLSTIARRHLSALVAPDTRPPVMNLETAE